MDKTIVQFEITAESPLAFPERRIGNRYYRSRDFIPGNALFGALGEHGRFDAVLFQRIRMHNAYPTRSGDAWVRPLPSTAQQPKAAKTSDDIIDTLIYRVCWERQQPTAYVYAPRDAGLRPYEPVGNLYYTLDNHLRKVTQRSSTRVSINQHTRTAQDGLLYSFSHLDEWQNTNNGWEPTTFLGSVSVDTAQQPYVTQLIQSITAVGGRKTSGIGSIHCQVRTHASEVFSQADLIQRITTFNQKFHAVTQANVELGGQPWNVQNHTLFTVNLVSDAILMRDGWVPSHTYDSQQLFADTGIKAELVRSFSQATVVGGWNTTWRRHRESAVATRAGGVFVFASEQPLSDDAYNKLYQLQLSGIGVRCNEGFGQIIICDPFHI